MAAEPTFRRCTRLDFAEATNPPTAAPSPTITATLPLTNSAFGAVEKRALLVGGHSPARGASVSQMLEYDMSIRQWTVLPTAFPFPISEATMVAVSGVYFLFGGWDDTKPLDGMWKLETQNAGDARGAEWTQVLPPSEDVPGPSARRGHSMVVTNTSDPSTAKIYVYGGFDGQQRLGDLWEFNVASSAWRYVDLTTGVVPPPRDAAMLAVDAANKRLVLFGGYGACRLSDLYTYELEESRWTKYPADMTGPTPRHGCFATVQGSFLVVGLGLDGKGASPLVCQLNLNDMKWTVPTVEGDQIEGRAQASYGLVEGGKRVLVFGGTNGKKYSNSIFEFDLEKIEMVQNVKGKK